ncbi:MAG: ABC transporter permease [Myxococcota bacterium]
MTTSSLGLLGVAVVGQGLLLFSMRRWLRQRNANLVLALCIAAALLIAAVLLRASFYVWALDIERHIMWIWLWTAVVSTLLGAVVAVRSRRLPPSKYCWQPSSLLRLSARRRFSGLKGGLASPQMRALLVLPAVLVLSSYLGASVGYLVWGSSGRSDLRLSYEGYIGRRFLLLKSSPVLSTVTTISLVGVALGVWLVIVAMAILNGFEHDLQTKIIGTNAHLLVQRDYGRPFEVDPATLQKIVDTRGVEAATVVVEGEVAIASRTSFGSSLVFGIQPDVGPKVFTVLRHLKSGSLAAMRDEVKTDPVLEVDGNLFDEAPAAIPYIVIGVELRKALNVDVGDRVNLLSPTIEKLTPVGVAPKTQPFEVAATFASGMYEFDAHFAYVSVDAARRFFEYGDNTATAFYAAVDKPRYADNIATQIQQKLSDPKWEVLDWKRRNENLFSALKLERVITFIVLVFIILVASFSIVNTLTMSIIEKKKEIAILKTMGARSVSIMKIFLTQGMLVGVFGAALGCCMALLTVWFLQKVGFWIPGEVYYIDSLPVKLSSQDLVLVMLAALVIVWDFAVFPALKGASLAPVEGLRDG